MKKLSINFGIFGKAKRHVVIIMLLLVTVVANAVPAKPGLRRLLTLTDGTTVSAILVGDEHGHYWLGDNGRAYQTIDGSEVFQVVDAQAVEQKARQRRNAANRRRVRRLTTAPGSLAGGYHGQKKCLIILVNFKDRSFKDANDNALYQRIANEKDFKTGSFKGSMYDYFLKQSGGQFELTFDVVGPVTVSQNASYYGSNDSQGNDKYAGKMVIEALKLADSEVNYKDYDWNDDDEVDQVYLVYAGKGEADGGASNTIWPHAYTLDEAKGIGDGDGAQTLDGVRIDSYACGAELNGSSGKIAGIGTMCHEFSHCLGYPDFYDTDYSGGQGMFQWDLMDSGSYNGDGYLPAGYTSYERWAAGWLMPKELSTTMTVNNMKSLQDGGESYVIYNQGNRNEFYLLENRQQTSWDAGIPGKGLLILHVDYDADAWRYNTPNDDLNHQRMTWVAADNKYQYTVYNGERSYTEEGAKNDPFPYGSVNAFNKNTTPAAKFYNKNSDGTKYMDSSVEEITQNSDGTVSFKFVAKEDMSSPVPTDPTTVTGSGNFDLVTDATTLNAGDQILIACVADGEAMALGTNQKTNNREAVTVTLNSDGSLIPSDDTQVITLEKDGSDFLFNVGNGYLYAASSSSNYLRTEETADDNALADISIDSNGEATIAFQGDYTHNIMRYNPNGSNPLFSCYLSTSTAGKLPQIYRKTVGQGGDDPTGDDTPTQAEIQLGEGKTMAGYSFSETLDFSGVTNGKAWIASGFTRGTKVMLCRVEIVPANTGFVVTSDTPGDKIIAPVSSEKAYYANLLIPILEEKTIYPTQIIDGVDYTFMGIGTIAATGKTGFVKVPREQTYGPNKSLLKVPTEYLVNEARGLDELEIVFDETSSINEALEMNWRPGAESQFATAQIYDLQGRRIKGEGTATANSQLKKGIYIYKGKKIVIK